jgi:hypothetical protein
MGLPKVTIAFSNGNLLKNIAAIDGIAGIVGTVQTAGLIGVAKTVYNLKDAEGQGFTAQAEPDFHRHLSEFYAELAGNQELHIMGVEDTMTMTQMLDKDNADGAVKLLQAAQGKVRLLAVFRKPDAGYDPGNGFFDSDIATALTKSITFGQDQNAKYNFLRVLIEGRIAAEGGAIVNPSASETDYAGVVVGGSQNDGSASIGTVLGRAVKYGAEIKIGKVANGPVQLDTVYIGTKLLSEYAGLEDLHDSGVISFMNHPTKAGFYIGIDNMANTGDYRLLAHGRIIDKAAIIAVATYVDELESEVDVDADGKIDPLDLAHLEGRIKQQINAGMGDQISKDGLIVYIAPDQDIINDDSIIIQLRIRPKGYTSFIDIDLGLTA